ncbi:glutaminase [Paucibacter sp. APW11]|uniref:Glutaminase n=1 Tax=Roseateles aquae TaxID=3077235 RepID=A0ABU3PFM9_9BURK|nr:glutaminase [Paucibacter sp. APW11]MDT9000736.1 glutaminase [Paucibacter sp. APW11]
MFERLASTLDEIAAQVRPLLSQGRVASYIPELATVPAVRFGMAVVSVDGRVFKTGDADQPFSIQSISKLFALLLALQTEGDGVWRRVGREPSGTAFNSLVQLESEQGLPRNPFINAGALAITDILCTRFATPENALVQQLRKLSGNTALDYNLRVANSERRHSDRNAAMAHFMRSFGRMDNPVDRVLDAYCSHCAIEMSCVDLARAVLPLAHHGQLPGSEERLLSASLAKRVNALMLTCGTYDAAGDFAFRVGLPAKSGVGGGIVALIPNVCGLCVWSPGLDANGNSLAGVQALELFTTLTGRSIF